MVARAVALVDLKAVVGHAAGEAHHVTVARDFGDDRGRGDQGNTLVSFDDNFVGNMRWEP